ncbi:YtxH domain-containing protein, partial [bacterium]|nr:YtxH domain-containing protein [bacterium]
MCKENDSLCFGIGIMAGVIGGVIAGVLLAPKKGEDSCKDIKCAVENLIETQAPNVKAARKQALEALDLVKY